MTAHNILNHLTSEYPELLCAAILTMYIAQEMHVFSNTFVCHTGSLTPESPLWAEHTENQPTRTSDTGSVPW